jgi:exopolysaccharide biosynthesis protein
VATEGPENANSVGLTLSQTAELMAGLGCETAYNLDGGSSSTMVLNNLKINALSTHKVRPIWDILYFASLVGTD